MSEYLLDSNIIIDFLIGRKKAIELLGEIKKIGHFPAISALCIAEVQLGVKSGEEEATNKFLESLKVYDLTRAIADRAGEHIREYKSKGITLSLIDTLIVATCIINDLVLVTYNTRHYPISGLKLWSL